MSRLLIALALGAAASAGGCASATPNQQKASSSDATCEERKQSARKYVVKALARNTSCAADKDCTTTEVKTLCFDMCTRPVSSAGLAEVKAAMQHADDAWCNAYRKAGCPVTIPPCAPPLPAVCKKGVCTDAAADSP